jgi:aspartyl-tRNA(Asn)/glutamyl-tRNA(Gln) amidotransferase subunit A
MLDLSLASIKGNIKTFDGFLELRKVLSRRCSELSVVNCLPQSFFEDELELAEVSAREKKLLSFVPFTVKDNIVYKRGFTTAGSLILKNYRSPFSATAVERLEDQGAIVVGKCNLDEFGMGSTNERSCFGPTKNPFDLSRSAGGSSGGSAAAVASRLCSFSLGSDTGGSVRLPASFCNCYGLKPTYGKVSRFGLIAFGSSLDQIGVIAPDLMTAAYVLETMAGFDPNDSTTVKHECFEIEKVLSDVDLKSFRIGLLENCLDYSSVDAEILRVYDYVKSFYSKKGCKFVQLSDFWSLKHGVSCYYVIATAEASSNLLRYDGLRYGYSKSLGDLEDYYLSVRAEGFGEEVKRRILIGTFVLSAGWQEKYFHKAARLRGVIYKQFLEAFKEVDLILTPCSPILPPKLGSKLNDPIQMYLMDIFTVSANLAGIPALAFPCGFSIENLPIGMQFMAPHFREDLLYRAVYPFELEHDFHKKLPPILSSQAL